VNPNVTAKLVLSLAVMSSPPWRTNSCKRSRPVQPSPGRMSSVSSVLPRFGVSGVTFHGSGFPYIGIPLTTACALRMPGGKTMTSYLERRPPAPEGIAATVCVLM
jgi:hypothetical protein